MDLDTIYMRFPDDDSCLSFLEEVRWGGRPECPYCKVSKSCPMPKERRHHCNGCGTTFSVTVRTMFHKTKVDLQRWFYAVWLITDPTRQVTVRELAAAVDVNKNTASYMISRIRLALLEQSHLVQAILSTLASVNGSRAPR